MEKEMTLISAKGKLKEFGAKRQLDRRDYPFGNFG